MESKTAIQLTPMQQAIEILQNRCIDLSIADDNDNPHARNAISEHEATIKMLTDFLPKEQEAIEQAYDEGTNNGKCDLWINATEYFTNTYGQTNND